MTSSDGKFGSKTRHNDDHKMWSMSSEVAAPFLTKEIGESIFVAELLHSKVSGGPKNTLYVFDVLMLKGKHLTGVTYEDRMDMAVSVLNAKDTGLKGHYVSTERVLVAKSYDRGFKSLFDGLVQGEDEGIVLKNPKAPLLTCSRNGLNSKWQVKCRKWNKNFSFAINILALGTLGVLACQGLFTSGLT